MIKILNYKNDIYNKLIFAYIIIDFILTYFGINYIGCIEEVNSAMAWQFDLAFAPAFISRIIIGAIIYSMYKFIQNNAEGYYKKIVVFALLIENYALILHVRWLILYFS